MEALTRLILFSPRKICLIGSFINLDHQWKATVSMPVRAFGAKKKDLLAAVIIHVFSNDYYRNPGAHDFRSL